MHIVITTKPDEHRVHFYLAREDANFHLCPIATAIIGSIHIAAPLELLGGCGAAEENVVEDSAGEVKSLQNVGTRQRIVLK